MTMRRPTLREMPGRTKLTLVGVVVLLHLVAIGLVLHREPKKIILPPLPAIEVSVDVVPGKPPPAPWVAFPVVLQPAPDVLPLIPDIAVGH